MKLCLNNFLDYNCFMQLCNLSIFLHSEAKNSQPIKSSTLGNRAGMPVNIGQDLVSKHVSFLKEFKSPGQDGLHSRVLRLLTNVISELLNEIFQSS